MSTRNSLISIIKRLEFMLLLFQKSSNYFLRSRCTMKMFYDVFRAIGPIEKLLKLNTINNDSPFFPTNKADYIKFCCCFSKKNLQCRIQPRWLKKIGGWIIKGISLRDRECTAEQSLRDPTRVSSHSLTRKVGWKEFGHAEGADAVVTENLKHYKQAVSMGLSIMLLIYIYIPICKDMQI